MFGLISYWRVKCLPLDSSETFKDWIGRGKKLIKVRSKSNEFERMRTLESFALECMPVFQNWLNGPSMPFSVFWYRIRRENKVRSIIFINKHIVVQSKLWCNVYYSKKKRLKFIACCNSSESRRNTAHPTFHSVYCFKNIYIQMWKGQILLLFLHL